MYEELIRRVLGAEEANDIRPLGEGMESVACLVNSTTVFRIGKTADIRAALQREEALLPLLRPLVQVQIPDFEVTGVDEESGLPYVSYPLIEGEDLTAKLFRPLDETVQTHVLDQITAFLQAINGISLDTARACGIRQYDFDVVYKDLLERAQYRLYPQMGVDGQGYIEQIFERFFDRNPELDDEPVLLHADLSGEHMLFDHVGQELRGIIDFGDLVIGDPDYEYHWLYEEFGRDFVARLAEKMGKKTHRQFYEKQQTFIAANVLDDVLLMERQDYKAYRRALESINRGDFGGVYKLAE